MSASRGFHGRDFRGALATFGPAAVVARPPERPQAWLADLDRRIRHFETACVRARGRDTWTAYDAAWRRLTPLAGGISATIDAVHLRRIILRVRARRGVAA